MAILRSSPSWPASRTATAVLLLCAACAQAQQVELPRVVISSPPFPPQAEVTGFGDVPLAELPVSASVIGQQQITASGSRRLADLTRFDSSVTDAYDAPGYWDFVSIRGYTLDNRFNYRREGLPINAETTIPLDNKEGVEILKGTSGIQAGTSAPGGLVNYVVKRPTETDLRSARLEFTSRASVLAAVDIGGRAGDDRRFGYRLNIAQETLRPLVHNLDGERNLVALATDWRVTNDSVVSAEIEWSHKKQASQVGYSLLGDVLPAPVDPRRNLNNQSWAQPSVFDALTGTLRFDQSINAEWRWTAQLGTQHLKNNDYTAFPFGCSAEGNYDRYCSDGTFDYYDFRSEDERRRQDAAALNLKGHVVTGSMQHNLSLGLLASRVHNRFQPQAYNYVGTGNIDGTAVVPPDPTLTYPGTNRDERSLEVSAQDRVRFGERWSTWLGVRHTRLHRESVMTDGSQAGSYNQGVTTPWAAVSYQWAPQSTMYASWGQGVESQQVSNNPAIYSNPGQVLPALKSRQWEIGAKGANAGLAWQVAWFDISRPMSNIDFCDIALSTCTGQFDGREVHRGIEAAAQWAGGPWRLGAGMTLLHARREGSTLDPASNGHRPPNVPEAVLRAEAAWKITQLPGLELRANASHEGRRAVLADESIMLPAWTRFDAALRYETGAGGALTTWTVGVDNLADKRYWRESPYQFGHVYLYPGAARTFRVSVTAAL